MSIYGVMLSGMSINGIINNVICRSFHFLQCQRSFELVRVNMELCILFASLLYDMNKYMYVLKSININIF